MSLLVHSVAAQVHGTSSSTESQKGTGQLYVQCVLSKHELGDFDDWLVQVRLYSRARARLHICSSNGSLSPLS